MLLRPFGSVILGPPIRLTVTFSPSNIVGSSPSFNPLDNTSPDITCIFNTASKVAASISANSATSNSSRRATKAAFVGANTVNGPSPLNIPTKSVVKSFLVKADTNMSKSELLVAISTTVAGSCLGKITVSITCTTPLEAVKSAGPILLVRPLGSVKLAPPVKLNVIFSPNNIVFSSPSMRSPDTMESVMTCIFKTASSVSSGTSSNSAKPNSSNNATKASSVGANTVNGPSPDKTVTKSVDKPGLVSAVSKIVWSALLTTTSTTVVCASAFP